MREPDSSRIDAASRRATATHARIRVPRLPSRVLRRSVALRGAIVCLGAWFAECPGLAAEGGGPPNVLLIMADDLRPELGCEGSPARTPNLDRLAAEGVRFSAAYCQQAVCNASRSSLLTGRRPDALQVWSNSVHFRTRNPDVATIPSWFRAQGYETRCAGKIFHNWHTRVRGDPESWSAPEFLHFATHGDDAPFANLGAGEQPPANLPPNLAEHSPRMYGRVPLDECRDVPDEAYYDGRVAAEAVRLLGKFGERPFFLAVGFWKPHAPFTAPRRYWDLYDRDELPPLDARRPAGAPALAFHESTEILGPVAGRSPLAAAAAAEMRHGYLAAVSFMDAQVGKVLDALEASEHADDTVVLFTSDHGLHIGEHGLWGKTSNFELDARVPLVLRLPDGLVAGPRALPAGCASDALVELVDLFPTLVDACGLPMPDGLAGASLLPLLRGDAAVIKPAAFTQHPRPAYFDHTPAGRPEAMGVSVRTPRVRYTEWRDWETGATLARELYDHDTDPGELCNAVDEAALAPARREAEQLLHDAFPAAAGPPVTLP